MSSRNKFLLAASAVLIILNFTCRRARAQTPPATPAGAPAGNAAGNDIAPQKVIGEVSILSDYLDKGITQTDHKFAVQGLLGYQWINFKTGIWGTNVALASASENTNVRIFLSYKFVWTQNSDLTMRYDYSKYFSSGVHDGNIYTFDFNFMSYHVLVESSDNYEDTGSTGTYFGFYKDWPLPNSLSWDLAGGFSTLKAAGYNGFLYAKAGIAYKYKEIAYSLNASFNSAPSQFSGRADLAIWLGIQAKF